MSALLAAGQGVLGVAGAYMEQQASDAAAEATAKSYGIKTAGIDFAADRTAEILATKVVGIQRARFEAESSIDKAKARAESDAKVNAAAAGVDGHSTDAVINETARTAAEAKGSLDSRVRAATLQLQTDYIDNYLNAHISKGNQEYNQASRGERTATLALGFMKGFSSGI